MKIYIDDYKILVIVVLPKTIRVDLPIKVKKSLKHEIKFIINLNESFAEYAIKNEISQLFFKYGYEYRHEHKKEVVY